MSHLRRIATVGLGIMTLMASTAEAQGPCEAELQALREHFLEEDREFEGLANLYELASFEFEDLYYQYVALEGQDHNPLPSGTFDELFDLNQQVIGFVELARGTAERLTEKRAAKMASLEECLKSDVKAEVKAKVNVIEKSGDPLPHRTP